MIAREGLFFDFATLRIAKSKLEAVANNGCFAAASTPLSPRLFILRQDLTVETRGNSKKSGAAKEP